MSRHNPATYLYKGDFLTVVQLMEFSAVSKAALVGRLRTGWDAEDFADLRPIRYSTWL